MPKEFAEHLRRLRVNKGLTQEAVAHAAKISVSTISKLEQGRFEPTLSTLRALAAALGVGAQELIEYDQPARPRKSKP